MDIHSWLIFAGFWTLFVTTPGPNAVNCILNGVTYGFRRSLFGVLAILTQASLFLTLSVIGVSSLVVASPTAFLFAKLFGAAFLIYLGVRGWVNASNRISTNIAGGSIYWRALSIATINPKSVAGYLAAFTQFIEPNTPITAQMWVIVPTALCLTTLSYCGYTALGALIGKTAIAAVMNTALRRGLAICFMIYGFLLGLSAIPLGART